ncbi:hypothetical protein O3M35_007697 [Rhynocoris fuscipes]|uniref:Protein DP71L n=1 Tax=Rhynocoris fuscipes TaxID=488301 RepID=A0AAW1DB58_9HEMI
MPFITNMVLQDWPHKSFTKDFIPQMQNKFVERAFLVGGFVGSKSQAGSTPSRAHISLNDVILEQLLNLGLNLCNDIISVNCNTAKNMMPDKVPFQNFSYNWRSNSTACNNYNWRSNNVSNKSMNATSSYFCEISGRKHCDYYNNKLPKKKNYESDNIKKTTSQVPALTKHSQEELVYEDKDEGGNSIYVYQEVQKSTCEVTKTSMFHVRSRTISDCSVESDDSFIIFEKNDDGDDDENDDVIVGDCDEAEEEEDDDEEEDDEEDDEDNELNLLENDENENEDSSSEDESDICDEVDHLAPVLECHSLKDTPSRIEEANEKWNKVYINLNSSKSPQKVSFASGKQLTHVRTMFTWDYAHRSARKGPWETLALDTCRFRSKIQKLSDIISPILDQNHRKLIFNQRFQTSSS